MLKKLNIVSTNPLSGMDLSDYLPEGVDVAHVTISELREAFDKNPEIDVLEGFLPFDWAGFRTLVDMQVCRPFPDHAMLREKLSKADVPQPKFVVLTGDKPESDTLESMAPPLLVRKGTSERFVEYVDDVSLAVRQLHKDVPTDDRVVVEEIVTGDGYSFYGEAAEGKFSLQAVVMIERNTGRGQYPVGMVCPGEIDTSLHEKMVEAASNVVSALDAYAGDLRLDFTVQEGEPHLRSANPCVVSPWMPVDLLSVSGVYNLFENVLRAAVELPRDGSSLNPRGAAVRWLDAGSGLVEDIHGLEFAERMKGVERIHLGVAPGDRLRHVVDARERDRVGYVVAVGDTADEARDIAKRAAGCIRIETKNYIEATEFS